jgi:hypothetical protein
MASAGPSAFHRFLNHPAGMTKLFTLKNGSILLFKPEAVFSGAIKREPFVARDAYLVKFG